MKNWYAIYVRPRAEKKVALGLEEAGFEYYLPLQRTLRRWSDRKKWVDLPLIPGYCFVHVIEHELLSVVRLDHVLSVIRFNGKPAVIPDMQLEFLRRLLNQNDVAYQLSGKMPEPGQTVEIIAGPFIGLNAEMIRAKGKSKIYLRLEQLMNAFVIEIPLEHVVVVQDVAILAE
jgi:transcription antitermination factor NusG